MVKLGFREASIGGAASDRGNTLLDRSRPPNLMINKTKCNACIF